MRMDRRICKVKSKLLLMIFALGFFAACQAPPGEASLSKVENPEGMSQAEAETLNSLEQIDPYPLYTMHYSAGYDTGAANVNPHFVESSRNWVWSCSLFAVYGDPENMLFGRNFDWDFSPGLMLFTDPPGGYASVSMVDIAYLGYGDESAYDLIGLPLTERAGLLNAPYLPFDGLNEAGLAVGMASVPVSGVEVDPSKETIDSVMVIRKILDQAATVDQAVEIIKYYNIDWGSGPPLHYFVAEKSGRSALVEFSDGEVVVIPNSDPWQPVTNFLVSESWADPGGHCWRYDLITDRLSENQGVLSQDDAMDLLRDVAQDSTQWSVVYDISSGSVDIVMGGNYENPINIEFEP